MKILVASDGSPSSLAAISFALSLLNHSKDYFISIVYFVPLNPPQSLPYLDHLDKVYNLEIEEEAVKVFDTITLFLGKKRNVTCEKRIGEGDVGEMIVDYAKNHKVDWLILGTRNLSGIKKFVMGSISEYVLHHSNCPVTLVKE